jgi:hypothetical protein
MVGQLLMDADEMRRGWVIDPVLEGRRGKSGGVQCITAHDITKDGVKDIIVGRDDGGVEVWSFDSGPTPQLVFERALQESITYVEGGSVTNQSYDEVVVTTCTQKALLERALAVAARRPPPAARRPPLAAATACRRRPSPPAAATRCRRPPPPAAAAATPPPPLLWMRACDRSRRGPPCPSVVRVGARRLWQADFLLV